MPPHTRPANRRDFGLKEHPTRGGSGGATVFAAVTGQHPPESTGCARYSYPVESWYTDRHKPGPPALVCALSGPCGKVVGDPPARTASLLNTCQGARIPIYNTTIPRRKHDWNAIKIGLFRLFFRLSLFRPAAHEINLWESLRVRPFVNGLAPSIGGDAPPQNA